MKPNDLPTRLKLLIDTRRVGHAIAACETPAEEICCYEYAGRSDDADEQCRELLVDQLDDDPSVEWYSDGVTIVTDDFVGAHDIVSERGDQWLDTVGSYTHEPTGRDIEHEPHALIDRLEPHLHTEAAGEAARAAYRRSRI